MVTLVNNLTSKAVDPAAGYEKYLEPDTRVPPKSRPILDAISVNGEPVREEEILAEAQHHPADNPGEAIAAAAQALVVKQLLIQEAKRLGIDGDPHLAADGRVETIDDAAIRTMIDREVDVPTATESECRRYYDNNPQRFTGETIHEVRHILLAVAKDDCKAREQARSKAAELIALILEDVDRFESLAEEFSACPSAKQGGNLGQITAGQTVAEFEEAVQELSDGEVTAQPVETRYGFHIAILDRRIDGRAVPYQEVSERISTWLQSASWARAVAQYVGVLAGNSVIKGVELASSDGPLVQ